MKTIITSGQNPLYRKINSYMTHLIAANLFLSYLLCTSYLCADYMSFSHVRRLPLCLLTMHVTIMYVDSAIRILLTDLSSNP